MLITPNALLINSSSVLISLDIDQVYSLLTSLVQCIVILTYRIILGQFHVVQIFAFFALIQIF